MTPQELHQNLEEYDRLIATKQELRGRLAETDQRIEGILREIHNATGLVDEFAATLPNGKIFILCGDEDGLNISPIDRIEDVLDRLPLTIDWERVNLQEVKEQS